MRQIGIFNGRVQICYAYGRFGWTRNGGKTWHGGIDLVGLDDKTIRMPFYKGKKISGKIFLISFLPVFSKFKIIHGKYRSYKFKYGQ